MMNNPIGDNNNSTGKAVGAIFVALYSLVFVGLFVWATFDIQSEEVQAGMLIDFGVAPDSGQGAMDTQLADDYVVEKPQDVPKTEPVETQDVEPEAPEVEEGNLITDTKTQEAEQVDSEPEQPEEEIKPREVNRRALFPGNKPDSPSPSQGTTDNAQGNQGYIGGTEADNYEGTGGEGGFEPDWNLEGRRPRNEWEKPKYLDEEQGVVVVEIWVNGAGDVIGASVAKGGTTSSPRLIDEALKAAKKVKFSESEQDLQVGTITYNFRLNPNKKVRR